MTIALYSALSGLQASQTRLDVSAHNLANISTPGFKASRTTQASLPGLSGTKVAAISPNPSQGAAVPTGHPDDRAVNGDGHFEVGDGIYTRNGAFTRDAEGRLVDSEGRPLREGEPVGFRNPGGLVAQGGSAFRPGPASGGPVAGNGDVVDGALEASNTDLAREVVQQIVAQRSFEANLETIRTVDEMTEALLDIRA